MVKRVAMAVAIVIAGAAVASAQSSTLRRRAAEHDGAASSARRPHRPPRGPAATQSAAAAAARRPATSDTRPATTTINGDTGLWFVPTGEVLPAKKWSLSAYRVNFDRDQGFTDVSDWPVTFGVGAGRIGRRLFGAWTLVRRIDRDVRPLFVPSQPVAGGVVNEHPFVRQGWSDNQLGDLWLGAKINLTSQWRQQPAAFALRGMVKLPTAKDDDEGVGTGQDGLRARCDREQGSQRSGSSCRAIGGCIVRGDPDGVDLSNGLRWGVGVGVPSRKSLRFTAELHGRTLSERHGDADDAGRRRRTGRARRW